MGYPRFLNLLRASIITIAAALLCACQVETTTLLSEKPEGRADGRLLGAWRTAPGQEGDAFLFIRERDDGGIDVMTLEYRDSGDNEPQAVQWESAVAWSAKAGDIDLLNVEADGNKYIVAYKFAEDGSFRFGFMLAEPFIAAVKAGTLKGKDNKSWAGSSVTLDDTPERITAFIRDNGGYELFGIGDGKQSFKMLRYSPK